MENGQLRVIVPNIGEIIPIYAGYQFCEFPGTKSKPIQEMTEQEIEYNIATNIKCLQ